MSSCLFHSRRFSVCNFKNSFVDRNWGPLLLRSFPKGKVGGGGGGGAGNLFRSRFMWPFSLRIFQNFIIHLFHSPVLRPGFPSFFSMDNLRDYGEDDTASSTGLGQLVARLPSSSEGLSSPTSPQTSLMAALTTATTLVTSGPVPAGLRPPHPYLRTVPWLWRISLLLLLQRSHMRRLWLESHGSWRLIPLVPGGLMPRSLLVQQWLRRRLVPDFPRPFWGTRTPPGLPSPRPPASGFGCPYLRPATSLLLLLGCGPDGALPLPWPGSVVHRWLRLRQALPAFLDLQPSL